MTVPPEVTPESIDRDARVAGRLGGEPRALEGARRASRESMTARMCS